MYSVEFARHLILLLFDYHLRVTLVIFFKIKTFGSMEREQRDRVFKNERWSLLRMSSTTTTWMVLQLSLPSTPTVHIFWRLEVSS